MNIRQNMFSLLASALVLTSCENHGRFDESTVEVPQFNFPKTVSFQQKLTDYGLFEANLSELEPADGVHLLELSSVLYTDHAYKQRLVKLPSGTSISPVGDGIGVFPDGAILTKTFYYLNDERDVSQGKRILETRLLVKESGIWNAATYLWNDEQTDATLLTEGTTTFVSWTDQQGSAQSTNYAVPSGNDCIACHQNNLALSPLGPTLRNLNKEVVRNGELVNQLSVLQNAGVLLPADYSNVNLMVDYHDESESIEARARAYLALNCAHCHQPNGWQAATQREFDFRIETPLNMTGIAYSEDKILRALNNGEMPFLGTTLPDHEGIELVEAFLASSDTR
jgi:uncharacterized repeat protein (TIGR03806 family)